jgi:hypothetical protein
MKRFTIAGLVIAFLIIGAFMFLRQTRHSAPQRNLQIQVYHITPSVFFDHLSHQISSKPGEGHGEMFARFLEAHQIHFGSEPDSLGLNEKMGLLFFKGSSSEQAVVARLVAQLNNP